jgi:diguanylate cyclase (GGDEF)-like protein
MMKIAPLPEDEAQRLQALRDLCVLDTPPEPAFDALTALAAQLFDVPVALVSLIDESRQWFKSAHGLHLRETRRDVALCTHTIIAPQGRMVVEDTLNDARFADNPLVVGTPGIRFYAGVALLNPDGLPLGTFCLIDFKPRSLDARQLSQLRALAAQAEAQLHLRMRVQQLHALTREMRQQHELLERQRQALQARCEELATEVHVDVLTGSGNRRAGEARLSEEFALASRLQLPLSVCLIDVDHFKDVNDSYGHPHGDEVLRRVARLIGEALRASDYVARFGGEEFLVVLPGAEPPTARAVAERIRTHVADAHWERPPVLTISAGVASRSSTTTSPEHLLQQADKALYRAKAGGRNRVESGAAPAGTHGD